MNVPFSTYFPTDTDSNVDQWNTAQAPKPPPVSTPPIPTLGFPVFGWPSNSGNFEKCWREQKRVAMCVKDAAPAPVSVTSTACYGKCGEKVGVCWCDVDCAKKGDCCPGFTYETGCSWNVTSASVAKAVLVPRAPPSSQCQGLCAKKTKNCWCDVNCERNGDCCPGFSFVGECALVPERPAVPPPPSGKDKSSGSSVIVAPFSNTCSGNCGKQVGHCWCDDGCDKKGDCCPGFSYATTCAGVRVAGQAYVDPSKPDSTCSGQCGQYTGRCWCDYACAITGDCCSDISAFCTR